MAFIIEAGSPDEVLHIASMHPAPRRAKKEDGPSSLSPRMTAWPDESLGT